jgi:hypothetical protein
VLIGKLEPWSGFTARRQDRHLLLAAGHEPRCGPVPGDPG